MNLFVYLEKFKFTILKLLEANKLLLLPHYKNNTIQVKYVRND